MIMYGTDLIRSIDRWRQSIEFSPIRNNDNNNDNNDNNTGGRTCRSNSIDGVSQLSSVDPQ